MEQSTGELIKRLSRLELQQARLQRSNKHLRMMTSALILISGALVTMAQTSSGVPDTLQAQQFLLRDSGGKLRGAMGVTSDGAVGFNLSDSNARPWRWARPVNPGSVSMAPMAICEPAWIFQRPKFLGWRFIVLTASRLGEFHKCARANDAGSRAARFERSLCWAWSPVP